MAVVACPKCNEEVTVPPRAPKEAVVRCPLCYESYSLGDALAKMPPMLEIIEMPSSGGFDDADYADDRVASRKARYATAGAPSAAYSQAAFARELAEEDADQSDLQFAGSADPFSSTATLGEEGVAEGTDPTALPAGRPQVKRPPMQPGSKKKRKQASPVGSIIAIVLGGAMAIPCALLLLLWLPGSLAKDPFQIAPWLTTNAPYLVPEHMKKTTAPPSRTSTANRIDTSSSTDLAGNNTPKRPEPKTVDDGKGLQFGNKFDNALGGNEEEKKPAPMPEEPLKPEDPLKPEVPNIPDPLLPMEKPEEPKGEAPVADPAALTKALEAFTTIDTEFDIVMAGDDKDAKRTVGNKWYQTIASLAAQIPADPAPVEDTFAKLVSDANKVRVVGLLALNTMKAEKRTSDGIVLSGTVKLCRKAAEGKCEMKIEVAAGKPAIVVIGSELAEETKVLIAGKVVEDPATILSDYAGSDTKAVQMLYSREIK